DSELYARSLHLLRSRGLFRALFDANHQLRMRGDWVRYLVHDLRNALAIITANFDFAAESTAGCDADVMLALSEGAFGARRKGTLTLAGAGDGDVRFELRLPQHEQRH